MTKPFIIEGESPDALITGQLKFDLERIGATGVTDEEAKKYLKENFGEYPEKLAKLIFFPITMNACNPEVSRILLENMKRHFEIMEDEIRAVINAADCGRECERQ
jgi:hypothetical protein